MSVFILGLCIVQGGLLRHLAESNRLASAATFYHERTRVDRANFLDPVRFDASRKSMEWNSSTSSVRGKLSRKYYQIGMVFLPLIIYTNKQLVESNHKVWRRGDGLQNPEFC